MQLWQSFWGRSIEILPADTFSFLPIRNGFCATLYPREPLKIRKIDDTNFNFLILIIGKILV